MWKSFKSVSFTVLLRADDNLDSDSDSVATEWRALMMGEQERGIPAVPHHEPIYRGRGSTRSEGKS